MATTTPPEVVRSELQGVTGEASALLAAAAAERIAAGPGAVRGALFEAADAIAETYKQAAAELAAAWYDELRAAAPLAATFAEYVAEPVAVVDRAKLETSVAVATTSLYDLVQAEIDRKAAEYQQQLTDAVETSVRRLQAELQKEIASGFRDTITENTVRDDSAVGWRRHTRPSDSYTNGCRWCRFLADKGAIYSKATARFAAHKECHCLASPVFDGDDGPTASVMQYVASKRKRTKAENAKMRKILDQRYGPDERTPAPDGGGSGGKPSADRPGAAGADDGSPDRSDKAAWEAYWDQRRAALPASYNPAEMLPPLEVEFGERMHALDEDISWISQANSKDRTDPVTGKLLPVHDFRWKRFATKAEPAGTEWEHKALEPETPVDAVHIERQITKATKKGKVRVVVDVGDRPLPDGALEELRGYNLRPERPSAAAVWVMSQGQLFEIDLLPETAET